MRDRYTWNKSRDAMSSSVGLEFPLPYCGSFESRVAFDWGLKVMLMYLQGVMQASAIEAYRSLKHSQGNGNGATLQSLKELVKRDADRSAQQAAS